MTQITKEAVLKAAENSTPQEALKELFPQYFEEEDTLAIKKGVFDSPFDQGLCDFCLKAFGNEFAILIARGSEHGNPAKLRSLIVSSGYKVLVRPSTHNKSRTTIEIHRRK